MNLLPGTLVGLEGPWARVRCAGGAEVRAGGGTGLYPGAAVVVGVRPADLRLVDAATAGAVRGTVAGIDRRPPSFLVRVDVDGPEGSCRAVTVECGADTSLPAAGTVVGLVFDPANGRVDTEPGRPPMRRGPDGPYLVDQDRGRDRP